MARSNFVIFFQGKEGTSALVRLLNNFDKISVVHQIENRGWEPFDRHNCGPMSLASLRRCLELIYGNGPLNMERLNKIYTMTGTRPLESFENANSVGFKMRFEPPRRAGAGEGRATGFRRYLRAPISYQQRRRFKTVMFDLLRAHEVVVFLVVRQDVLRWALSKYHGDGFGRPGHLQRAVADGLVRKEDLPKLDVDCGRLEGLILQYEQIIERKRNLARDLEASGVKVHPLLYEKFCSDTSGYLKEIFTQLGLPVSEEEISSVLKKGTRFKKVHSHDISEFVINHRTVLDRFGDRYVAWH